MAKVQLHSLRGILSRCRKAAKLLNSKWEVRDGSFIRLKDTCKEHGEFCPLTAAYFVETGERLNSSQFLTAADYFGLKDSGNIALAADDVYSSFAKRRFSIRRSLMRLVNR